MSDHLEKTVLALQKKIEDHEREIVKIKTTVNQLLDLEGQPALYTDTDLQVSTSPSLSIAPDAFFNKPLATAVRQVLDFRRAINPNQGPATVDDLYATMLAGGFGFENKNEMIAKRNISISLSKNMAFIRLNNGMWGVREWYGKNIKKTKDIVEDEGPANEITDDTIQPD